MKKLLLLLIPFLFVSCWIEPKIDKYEKKDNVCYCENYETLRTLVVPEINSTFKDWHWSPEAFDEKYNKYLHNIPISKDWISHLKKKGYEYLYLSGSSTEKIQCYNYQNKRKYIDGKYFIIIRNNGDAVTFYENDRGLDENTVPIVELPFTLTE